VATVVLLGVDGFLGVMAGYAAGRWEVGAAVFGVLFAITWLEFAVVAWASRRRQQRDKRRADS
jgi:ABC-type spermidine/putrescine transport system permease subunit I